MKTLRAFFLTLFFVASAVAQDRIPLFPASQAEVNAGVINTKGVTPATLASWTGKAITIPTNATATTIQAALNANTKNGVVEFSPGHYSLSVPLSITNGGMIRGNGAVLHWTNAAGLLLTGKMLDTGTNFSKRLVIENLGLDGGIYAAYNTATYMTALGGFFSYTQWTNRTGLRVECSADVFVRNCVFYGWPGNGCLAINDQDSFAYSHGKFNFVNNTCYSNLVDVFLPGPRFESEGYSGAPSSTWIQVSPEYSLIQGNVSHDSQMFMGLDAKNVLVCDNLANDNYCGVVWDSGAGNDLVTKNIFNHNVYGIVNNGSQFIQVVGNQFLACNTNLIFGAPGITFDNNFLGQTALVFTNGVSGSLRFNNVLAGVSWGTGIVTNFTGSPGLLIYGNTAQDSTNSATTDFSMQALSAVAMAYADKTNYDASRFAPPPAGTFKLVPSNSWIWGITATTTNRLFQYGP